MVETTPISRELMLSRCTTARASFLLRTSAAASAFTFGSSKQGCFLGSAGPIRFVVKEDETVATVIDHALKCYAREGRLPLLGSDSSLFLLYCPYSACEAFNPWGKIGLTGSRNFVLSKKSEAQHFESSVETTTIRKTSGKWKAWLNKSLGLMVPSH